MRSLERRINIEFIQAAKTLGSHCDDWSILKDLMLVKYIDCRNCTKLSYCIMRRLVLIGTKCVDPCERDIM